MVFREVDGLPLGHRSKSVVDAYGELVDEGCLVIFGPSTTDNAVPTREAIEQRYKVPAVSVTGTDDWLGEWTFSFPMGSLTDEPIFWARTCSPRPVTPRSGLLVEQSLIGESPISNNFRNGLSPGQRHSYRRRGVRSHRPPKTSTGAVRRLHDANVRARSCTAGSASGSSTSTPHWQH